MWKLRLLWLPLLAGCLLGIAIPLSNAPWDARLKSGNHTWIIHLGRHPVWQPPPMPDHAAFRREFVESTDLPPPDGSWDIREGYDPAAVSLEAVAYCWPVLAGCGALYLSLRGSRRDLVLHCAVRLAIWLFLAAATCLGMWCLIGGWGPTAPCSFVAVGFVGGIVNGLASFSAANAQVLDSQVKASETM